MSINKQKLELHRFRGSAAECGKAYGQRFATEILAFCQQEVMPNKDNLVYARKCWKHVQKSAPHSARFMQGMAGGANLSNDCVTLLSLHEEIVHQQHCTAFVASGKATRGDKTIVAMNWDWNTNLYAWPHLLKLQAKGSPRMVTYAYPGLWAGAGINEHGVAFMWTGSGYQPRVRPVVGVPTYVIIYEMLRRKSVAAVLKWLKSIKHAGAFIFFLGDPSGDTVVIEGMPGKLSIERGDPALVRANHYECRDMMQCAKQKEPSKLGGTTPYRAKRMSELVEQYRGRISIATAKKIMTDRDGSWPWLNQFPKVPSGSKGMTVDSLFADCQERTLWTCRGGREVGPWQNVKV